MDERETKRRITSLQERMGQLETRAGKLREERGGDTTRQFEEEQRLWKEIWEIQRTIMKLEQQQTVAKTKSRHAG